MGQFQDYFLGHDMLLLAEYETVSGLLFRA